MIRVNENEKLHKRGSAENTKKMVQSNVKGCLIRLTMVLQKLFDEVCYTLMSSERGEKIPSAKLACVG